MKLAVLALVLAVATAHPMKKLMEENDVPDSLDGSLHLVEG